MARAIFSKFRLYLRGADPGQHTKCAEWSVALWPQTRGKFQGVFTNLSALFVDNSEMDDL